MAERRDFGRKFEGIWIPANIYFNEEFSMNEKVLCCEVNSLDTDPDVGCWASNEYLGDFLGVSEGTMANMVSRLRKRGALAFVFFDGKNRGLRSVLHNPDYQEPAGLGGTVSLKIVSLPAKVDRKNEKPVEPSEPLTDPEKAPFIAETEKLIGCLLNLPTQEHIRASVPVEFERQWIDLVKDRLIANGDKRPEQLKQRLGYWLTDFRKDIWRYKRDQEREQQQTPAPSRTNQSFKGKTCDRCREYGGMIHVEGKGMMKCSHRQEKAA